MMYKSQGSPWDDPFNEPPAPKRVAVLWDYTTQTVVGEGHVPSLFDTFWTYTYAANTPFTWVLSRCPGDQMVLQECDVPEMVRLAAMVSE